MHLTDTGVLSLQCPKKSTSGNISYHFFCVRPSHQTHLIQSCLLTEAELRHDFFFFLLLVIKKVDFSSLLFVRLNAAAGEPQRHVFSVLWCWRPTGAGAEMYFTSYTKQRGGGGTTERTRVSAQCGERVTWIQTHRHTHTLAACCCSVAHG